MIQLDMNALVAFDHLKYPPTHAALSTRMTSFVPGASGMWFLELVYSFGEIDPTTGEFHVTIPDEVQIGVNPAYLQTMKSDERDRQLTLLSNLLSEGVVPDPSDPTKTIVVASKKAGECKEHDLDVVALALSDKLSGTIV